MAVFFISIALMVLATVAVLVWPLMRAKSPDSADRKAVNVAIAKQRLRELGRERDIGTLGEEAYEQAKYELELTLAGDLDDSEDRAPVVGGRWMAALVFISVPVLAGWLYFQLGSPLFLDDDPMVARSAEMASQMPPGGVEELVAKLEQRMQEHSDDPEGQRLLIRTYMSQGRFADAVASLESWGARDSDNPNMLVMLADAIASQGGGRLLGAPEDLLEKALQLDPNHGQALWIMGYAQAQKNNSSDAIVYWQRLLPLLSGDPSAEQRVHAAIADTQQRAGMVANVDSSVAQSSNAAAVASSGLEVQISLAPSIAAKVSADDAVYVYAKSPSGPPMPLAVIKRRVSDLPLTIKLDDSSAMIPSHKLSGQSIVTIGARVSLGGGPVAQSGDFYIELDGVATPSDALIELVISHIK